jgi:Sec-independent protein translocase protein TatA
VANSDFYEAKLKARRWVEPIVLGPSDITPLSRDMGAILRTLEDASREIDRLKKSNAALRERRQPANPIILRDPRRLAMQIAEKLGDGPLAVYRGPKGGIAWCAPSSEMAGSLIGVYDAGADWRDIAQDLAA